MFGKEATASANEATKKARMSGESEDHKIAENLHRDAADAHSDEGNDTAAEHHLGMAEAHKVKGGSDENEDENEEKKPFGSKKPF